MSLSCTVSEIWRDIGQKSPFEPTAPLFGAPLGVIQFCRDLWRQKIRIPGLSYGFVCVILRLAVFVQCRLVTDGLTDGRTHDDSIYRASTASRGKY